jgi:hypothetical protein
MTRGAPDGVATLDSTGNVPAGQLGHASGGLHQTAVVTTTHTAVAGEVVRADISGGSFTVTLPSAPAAGTQVAVKVVTNAAGNVNALTVATGGSDVINKTAGVTSMALTLQGQAILLEYNTGIWALIATDDAAAQLATTRQGVWYLDSYTGTDDAKMTSALAAVFTAGGGTITLSARAHTFANQVATLFGAGHSVPLRIIGAGAISLDATGTSSYAGATTVTLSYSGSGAARWDFQHAGLIEISGILFLDSGGSAVPFIQTTCAVPNIHDNAFIGSAAGTACFQDAIVLGGYIGLVPGAGDSAQYTGYAGSVYRNSFEGIRRCVLLNPAANAVQVYGNTVSWNCGSNLPLGACIELLGTNTDKVGGTGIYGNCIEITGYPVGIKGTYAQFNTIGPNGFWDPTVGAGISVACHVMDINSLGNLIIMGETNASVPVLVDAAMSSTVINAGTAGTPTSIASVYRSQQAFYNGSSWGPVVQSNGLGVMAGDYYGNYSTWRTGFDVAGYPQIQAYAVPGTQVTDGSTISGSNVVTSLTAAWSANDIGVYIRSADIASGSVIQLAWTAATAQPWQASYAYVAGQVARPVTATTHLYQCTVAGTTGSSQPTWPTSGGTVTDGGVTWTDLGAATAVQFSGTGASGTATGVTTYFGRKGTAVSMTAFAKHHIVSSGTAPTVAVATAGAGTGATASVAGNDLAHTLTLNTGTGPATGLQATVTFNVVYDAAPKMTQPTPKNVESAGLSLYYTTATGTWTLNAAVALTASTTYVFDVILIQ